MLKMLSNLDKSSYKFSSVVERRSYEPSVVSSTLTWCISFVWNKKWIGVNENITKKVRVIYTDLKFTSIISDHTKDTAPVSHQLTEVKLLQALAVLWWGTTWEGRVSDKNFFLLFFASLVFKSTREDKGNAHSSVDETNSIVGCNVYSEKGYSQYSVVWKIAIIASQKGDCTHLMSKLWISPLLFTRKCPHTIVDPCNSPLIPLLIIQTFSHCSHQASSPNCVV